MQIGYLHLAGPVIILLSVMPVEARYQMFLVSDHLASLDNSYCVSLSPLGFSGKSAHDRADHWKSLGLRFQKPFPKSGIPVEFPEADAHSPCRVC